MDQRNNINNLYQSINKSAEERKILDDLVLKNEAQVISTQSERHQLTLMQNFFKSELSESVECYNTFVEFINSIYEMKSSADRDSQDVVARLITQRGKAFEMLQKLTNKGERLVEELTNLNSQNQIEFYNTKRLAMNITELKDSILQMHLKINDNENLQKDLEEKFQVLNGHNQDLLSSINHLEDMLNLKTIDLEKCEREFSDAFTAAKLSQTEEFNLQINIVRTENSEMENTWKLDKLNYQTQFDELRKEKENEELTLESELDDLKREWDQLNHESNKIASDIQNLHLKNNEIHERENELENDGAKFDAKLKKIETQTTTKIITHRRLMENRRITKAEEQNKLKMNYQHLKLENELLKKKIKPKEASSSSQVTSTSTPGVDFDWSQQEEDNI